LNKINLRISQVITILDKEDCLLQGVMGRLFDKNIKLDVCWLENILETPEGIDRLESFTSKFSRMQDTFVDKLLPLFLKYSGEIPKTAIDNLHRLEQLNIIENADSWVAMRLLRNKLVHEYMDDTEQLFQHLMLAKISALELHQSFLVFKKIFDGNR